MQRSSEITKVNGSSSWSFLEAAKTKKKYSPVDKLIGSCQGRRQCERRRYLRHSRGAVRRHSAQASQWYWNNARGFSFLSTSSIIGSHASLHEKNLHINMNAEGQPHSTGFAKRKCRAWRHSSIALDHRLRRPEGKKQHRPTQQVGRTAIQVMCKRSTPANGEMEKKNKLVTRIKDLTYVVSNRDSSQSTERHCRDVAWMESTHHPGSERSTTEYAPYNPLHQMLFICLSK